MWAGDLKKASITRIAFAVWFRFSLGGMSGKDAAWKRLSKRFRDTDSGVPRSGCLPLSVFWSRL